MLPEEAVQAYKDLRAQRYFPIHWGMFNLALHHWYEPIEYLFEGAQKNEINLLAPRLGEIVYLNEKSQLLPWWRSSEKKV